MKIDASPYGPVPGIQLSRCVNRQKGRHLWPSRLSELYLPPFAEVKRNQGCAGRRTSDTRTPSSGIAGGSTYAGGPRRRLRSQMYGRTAIGSNVASPRTSTSGPGTPDASPRTAAASPGTAVSSPWTAVSSPWTGDARTGSTTSSPGSSGSRTGSAPSSPRTSAVSPTTSRSIELNSRSIRLCWSYHMARAKRRAIVALRTAEPPET